MTDNINNTQNTILIKRSDTSYSPSTLQHGELAYSFAAGTTTDGGNRLYIGNNEHNPIVIGGRAYTEYIEQIDSFVVPHISNAQTGAVDGIQINSANTFVNSDKQNLQAYIDSRAASVSDGRVTLTVSDNTTEDEIKLSEEQLIIASEVNDFIQVTYSAEKGFVIKTTNKDGGLVGADTINNNLTETVNTKTSQTLTSSKNYTDEQITSALNLPASVTVKDYVDSAEASAKKYADNIKESLGTVYSFKGSVDTWEELLTKNPSRGDVYNVVGMDPSGKSGQNYAYVGGAGSDPTNAKNWDALGGVYDFEAQLEDVNTLIQDLEKEVVTGGITSNGINVTHSIKDRLDTLDNETTGTVPLLQSNVDTLIGYVEKGWTTSDGDISTSKLGLLERVNTIEAMLGDTEGNSGNLAGRLVALENTVQTIEANVTSRLGSVESILGSDSEHDDNGNLIKEASGIVADVRNIQNTIGDASSGLISKINNHGDLITAIQNDLSSNVVYVNKVQTLYHKTLDGANSDGSYGNLYHYVIDGGEF